MEGVSKPLLEFRSYAAGHGSTISMPGDFGAGDLCVIWNTAQKNNPAPTTRIPTGFTSLHNGSGGTFVDRYMRAITSWKVLNGDETTFTGLTGGSGGGQFSAWTVAVFRCKSFPASPFSNSTPSWGLGNGVSAQTIGVGGQSARPMLALGQMSSNGGINTNISPVMSELANPLGKQKCHYRIYNEGDFASNINYRWANRGDVDLSQSLFLYW